LIAPMMLFIEAELEKRRERRRKVRIVIMLAVCLATVLLLDAAILVAFLRVLASACTPYQYGAFGNG